jgi:DNA-directed RNA polymerase specialized sigma24 family protein
MRDDVDDALDELRLALNRNIDRMQRALERSDEVAKLRAEGQSWREVVSAEERPLILELISQNLDDLYQAGGRLRRTQARALRAEGMSMEQIARLFGVTRQRVSALLKHRSSP